MENKATRKYDAARKKKSSWVILKKQTSELIDKEFKLIVLKLSDPQENKYRKLSVIRENVMMAPGDWGKVEMDLINNGAKLSL